MNLDHFSTFCLCKQSGCQRMRTPRWSDDFARHKERGNLNSRDPLTNKDKERPGTAEWMSLKCKLTKGHLTASQNKTELKALNKRASCTVFRTWYLFGRKKKIILKYLWHIAFLDFKCIKKEPAYIDVVNQYLLQCKANAVGSTVPFKAHIFLETSHFFSFLLGSFRMALTLHKRCSNIQSFASDEVTKHSNLFQVHLFLYNSSYFVQKKRPCLAYLPNLNSICNLCRNFFFFVISKFRIWEFRVM